MGGWAWRRKRSREIRTRFMNDTIDAVDLLHRRVGQIEEQLRQQQAGSQELERHIASAENEASIARLEIRDLIEQYRAIPEPHDAARPGWDATPEAEVAPQLLDSLMPVLTPVRSKRAASGQAAREGERDQHVCLVSTPDGYELLDRPGDAPVAGAVVELGEGLRAEVVKVARSPLPNDRRRCAYLEQAVAVATVEENVFSLELVRSG
jgi:hypothetical protein